MKTTVPTCTWRDSFGSFRLADYLAEIPLLKPDLSSPLRTFSLDIQIIGDHTLCTERGEVGRYIWTSNFHIHKCQVL